MLAVSLAAGCRPAPVTPAAKTPAPRASIAAKPTAVVATLTGKVKFLADAKTGLVSDHGGGMTAGNDGTSFIGDGGGGMISDHGGGVISNNSGGILSNNAGSFRLAQAGALAAFAVADAEVGFFDAAGKPLKGADGKPLVARTDKTGSYSLAASLPAGNGVARVTLKGGGELRALVVPGEGGTLTADLDTASTIGAAYVLDRLVKGDQAVFDRLPRAEAERLAKELATFPGYLVAAPTYRAEAMAQAAEALATRVPAVGKAIDDVKALLLGQARLGEGRPGTEVALSEPGSLVALPDGALLIGEEFFGRVRTLLPDGTITTLVDPGNGKFKLTFPRLTDLARAADGTIWAGSKVSGLYRLGTDGVATRPYADDRAPDGLPIQPESLAMGPDETLYVGEFEWKTGTRTPRVLALREGQPPQTLLIDAAWNKGYVSGLAVAPDGSLLVVYRGGSGGAVYRWRDGAATKLLGFGAEALDDVAVAPDGTIYVTQPKLKRVATLAADGTLTPIAGAGAPVGGADLQAPGSLAVTPDGTLWIADASTGQVWSRSKAGAWAAAAGAAGAVEVGDTTAFALNQPAGVAWGPDNALFIAEAGGARVRRFANGGLAPFAGTTAGYSGDGGPATAAELSSPAAIAFAPDGTLVIAEVGGQRVRAVAPDGTIRSLLKGNTIVGTKLATGASVPLAEFKCPNPSGVAATKDGSFYVVSADAAQLLRYVPGAGGGTVTALAGRHAPSPNDVFTPAGYLDQDEGDPASLLGYPLGMGIDPQDRPYVVDFAGGRILRVDVGADGKARVVRVAGRAMKEMVAEGARVAGTEETTDRDGVPATETTLVFPIGVAFGPDGSMYIAEAGTLHIGALSEVGGGAGDNASAAFVQIAIGSYGLPRMAGRIRKVAKDGTITTVAGRGSKFFGDEAAADALVLPLALAVAPDGRLAIADVGANMVRVLPAGSY